MAGGLPFGRGGFKWGENSAAQSGELDAIRKELARLKKQLDGLAIHTHQTNAEGGTLDHGAALTGRGDDDHTQYALLAGRSGGQTLNGDTASGGDLTLQSTAHATKGDIFFGANSKYREDTTQLLIGAGALGGTATVLIEDPDGGAQINLRSAVSGGTSAIEVGTGGTGNRFSHIDFTGDATYTDYGLRIIRNNTGANATSHITHRGTGTLSLQTTEAAAIAFATQNSTRMSVGSTGQVTVSAAQFAVTKTTTSTPTGTTQTIDWDGGNFQILDLESATGNVTLTLSNPLTGGVYYLEVRQDSATPRDVVWPATVDWPGGTAPVISVGADAVDLIRLVWNGTAYLGTFTQAHS